MKNTFTLILLLVTGFTFAQTDSASAEKQPQTEDSLAVAVDTSHKASTSTATLPAIVLKDVDGVDVDLSSYGSNDKITIISFWATWCKPCIKELKNINDLIDDWDDDYGVELVAISTDDPRSSAVVKSRVNGYGWDFDVLLDPNGDVQRAMNVNNPPVTFLIDKNGKVVYTHTGYVEGDEYELEDHIKEIAE